MKTLAHKELVLVSGGNVALKDGGFLIKDKAEKSENKTMGNFFDHLPFQMDKFLIKTGEHNGSLCIFGRFYQNESVVNGTFYRHNATATCTLKKA